MAKEAVLVVDVLNEPEVKRRIADLRAENARLRAENERLYAAIEPFATAFYDTVHTGEVRQRASFAPIAVATLRTMHYQRPSPSEGTGKDE